MPIEYTLLKNKPEPLINCPNCGAQPFESFMRGLIQRKRHPQCAIICASCKEIVGYEHARNKSGLIGFAA